MKEIEFLIEDTVKIFNKEIRKDIDVKVTYYKEGTLFTSKNPVTENDEYVFINKSAKTIWKRIVEKEDQANFSYKITDKGILELNKSNNIDNYELTTYDNKHYLANSEEELETLQANFYFETANAEV